MLTCIIIPQWVFMFGFIVACPTWAYVVKHRNDTGGFEKWLCIVLIALVSSCSFVYGVYPYIPCFTVLP